LKLRPGDRVCIIATAAQLRSYDRPLIADGKALLEAWGLQVDIRIHTPQGRYVAGNDDVRAGHLNASLEDPDTRAIFCARGGHGSADLLPRIDQSLSPVGKFLVGYSDLTCLQLAISTLWPQVVSIHGPNVGTRQLLGTGTACERNRTSLYDTLFLDRRLDQPIEFLVDGAARGRLQGGCLSRLFTDMELTVAACSPGCVLFVEEFKVPPHEIRRLIERLKKIGLFQRTNGVIFGAMTTCPDPYANLKKVLRNAFAGEGFPVGFGLASGHGDVNLSIRLGGCVEMDSSAARVVTADRSRADA
jgi:muramoyltetrapeptide carboxypeptidase